MALAATATRPATEGWKQAFTDLPREHGHEPLDVEGRIPAELRGTIVRNGASMFAAHGRRYDHWFDGDGGLSAVRFADGRATGAARLVQSAGLVEERRAGRMLYGGFGTVQPGLLNRLRGKVKNTGNTSVMFWGGKLYALMEASLPTEMVLDDLGTVGESDLGGVVPRAFSAHPHRVAARAASYNFGVRYGRHTLLDLFELRDDGRARLMASLPLSGPTLVHDFIATDRHLIFFLPPVRLKVLRAMLGMGGFAANLAWRPEQGTEILVVPIDAPDQPIRFTAPAFLQWHYANAFERGDEIVVDLVRYPDGSSILGLADLAQGSELAATPGTALERAVITPAARRIAFEKVWERSCEFPRVAPADEARPYRTCWLAAHARGGGGGLHDTIARVDLDTGSVTELTLPAGRYTSEPVVVDGWVLALIYDAVRHVSGCAVLDVRDLQAGPVATAWFDHHVPPRFHGIWVPA